MKESAKEGLILLDSVEVLMTPLINIKSRIPFPIHCVKGAGATHILCNRQAVEILKNDSYIKEAKLFSCFEEELALGSIWADKGFKSFYHFYDAKRGVGKWKWPKATEICEQYINKAEELWRSGKHKTAMFYLGAATHLVQDMCVPHHSCCILTEGHTEFEEWTEENRERYCVFDAGIYMECENAWEWVYSNAVFSREYFPYVKAESPVRDYHYASNILLPRTQRSTSGFWVWFYNKKVHYRLE